MILVIMFPELQRNRLLAEIREVFKPIARGNGITWHEAEEMDCHGSDQQRKNARLLDIDRNWTEVRPEWIERFSSALTFLDEEGFCYYLPAVMQWSLHYAEDSDSSTADNLLSNLADLRRRLWLNRNLNDQQIRALAKFVDFMLRHYWVTHNERTDGPGEYW